MPQHLRSEVTDLSPIDDGPGEDLKDLVQQERPARRQDVQDDLEDDDLGDEDLDDEEDLEDDDEEDLEDDDQEEEGEPKGRQEGEKEVQKDKLFKNPLPPKDSLPPELHEAWDVLNAARKSQNTDYTTKTMELAEQRKKVGAGERIIQALDGTDVNPEQFAEGIAAMAESVKRGVPAEQAAEAFQRSLRSAAQGPQDVLSVGEISLEEALATDPDLSEYADLLSDDTLSDGEINAYTVAYRNREAAIRMAVDRHNEGVENARKGLGRQRTEQLETLKRDKNLGRVVTKHQDRLLAAAEKAGATDLKAFARVELFDEFQKEARRQGRRRLQVSRRSNLDVGEGPSGDYSVSDLSDRELDNAFETGGLAGMMKATRTRVGNTGVRRRR